METYKKQLFGYQREAVEASAKKAEVALQEKLEIIANQQQQMNTLNTEVETLTHQNEELAKKVEKLSHELANYDNIEQTLSTALVVAQEAAQNLRVMAAKEAQLIVAQAHETAKQETSTALAHVQTIQMQEEQLKRELQVFKTRIKMLLEAQLELNADEVWGQIFETGHTKISNDGTQVNQDQSESELGTVEA